MMALKKLKFGYGDITFNPKIESIPATSKTSGMVQIDTIAKEGHPAYFEVGFSINACFELEGLEFSNYFHLSCVVPNAELSAPYKQVENQAAERLAPLLRSMADEIEKQVNDVNAKRKKLEEDG